MQPIRLTLICPRAYPALMERKEMFGGAERHSVLLCKGFAARGHTVSLVTLDPGPGNPLQCDGVQVLPTYSQEVGVPWIRFFHPGLTRAVRFLSRAHPQIAIQPVQSPLAGITAWMAHRAGIPWIHMITSDAGVDGTYDRSAPVLHRRLYSWGIRRANAIVAQTYYQQSKLKENYGLDSMVIRNPTQPVDATCGRGEYVVWAGQLFPIKRPELLLELSKRLPEIQFMVAGANTGKLDRRLAQDLDAAANIHLLGQVPSSEMGRLYEGGGLFLNTSRWEGLSNAFLEAWQHGLPVCSLAADPDEIIAKRSGGSESIGIVEPDLEAMAATIQKLMVDSPQERVRMGLKGMDYVKQNHNPSVVFKQWEDVIGDCLRRAPGDRRE